MAASTRVPKVQLGARVPPEIRRAAIAAADAAGLSLNVWVERTLAAALREPKGGRPSEAGESAGSTPAPSASAPQRAPAADGVGHFVFPASALVNESEAERSMRLRARAEAERAIVARQVKLNAAKAGQPKRKGS